MSKVLTPELISRLKKDFALNWKGIHGAPHWSRVRLNGLKLAQQTGADPVVVELFAFLHDSQRESDFKDPEHGLRAALYIQKLLGKEIQISDKQAQQLIFACEHHTYPASTDDQTILTCWDADKLDLGRVGITLDLQKLHTPPARDSLFIASCQKRIMATVALEYEISPARVVRI